MHTRIITRALAALFLVTGCASTARTTESKSEVQTYPKPDIRLNLYPEGQNVDKGIALGPLESNGLDNAPAFEEYQTRRYTKVSDPFIDIYLPKKCNGQMLVVCPGGGYKNVCADHEGALVAKWCLDRNIACCVVVYRLPFGHHKVPLTDVQNAFRYCRAHADNWGVKQIGVCGFSAGGHLAASASTLFVDDITRPDFSVLVYPVIDLEHSFTHKGTSQNLTGGDPELKNYYSLQNRVSSNTPKTILILSADDKAVPPMNSLLYYEKLLECKVSSELHIMTSGGHGWGFGPRPGDQLEAGQRENFNAILTRWIEDRAKEIK